MTKAILLGLASIAALGTSSAAAAQDTPVGEVFIVGSLGYHDLGVGGDVEEEFGLDIDDASVIYGAAIGFDIPVSSNVFVGIEGNFHFGNDVIDNEFGGNARLGVKAGGNKFYVRGGYQQIDLDPSELIEGVTVPPGAFDDIDDSDGDFLVGVGADFPLGGLLVRGTVDTVSFDTVRATVGVGLAF